MKQFTIFNQLTAMPKRLAMVLTVLFTLGVGSMLGAGSETFENASNSSSYGSVTWKGDNGLNWSASSFRTDQKITGNRGLTSKASTACTITMPLTTAQRSEGMGVFTFKYKYPYSDSGKKNNLSFTINGKTYTGTVSYNNNAQTVNITVNQGNLPESITINIASGGRACFDDFSWTSYVSANPCTVTLEAGPGTCAAYITETSAGKGVTLPTPTLNSCGEWRFAGWKETSAVSTETTTAPTLLSAGSIYKPTNNCTLYAVYQRTETTQGGGDSEEIVDFSKQNYTNGDVISTYTGTDFSVAFNKGTNSNDPKYYTSGTAIRIYGGGYFTISSESIITKIVITFGSSDGSNAITTDVDTYSDGTWTGSANSVKFTIGGSSGNRRIKSLAVTTSGGGSTTTYYHSTPDCGSSTYTVTFNANGHGTTPREQTITSGGKASEPTAPTATGYTFGGWYKEEGCTNAWNFATDVVTKNTTLYAKWTAIQTTITLSANGGSGNTTKVAATYDSSTLNPSSITNPTKTGYTFGGWYSGEGGTGSQVINSSGKLQANVSGYTGANGVWKATTNKTLYAKWTPSVYTITYKDQDNATFSGTHESGNPTQHTYGTETTLKGATKTGYTFGGWYKEAICTNKVTSLGATDYTGNITLYAKWTQKVYTVTATSNNNNYGTVSVSGTTITASPKTGYTYANHAYTVTSGTATVTQNGNTFAVTPSTNCTIRINFEAIPSHKVYFNTGGLNEITPVDVTEGSTYNITQTPTGLTNECEYNTFAGWTTSSTSLNNATECPEIITSIMMGTDDITLYAVYSKTETTQGSGSGESHSITITPGTFTNKGTNSYGSGAERIGSENEVTFGGHYITGNANNTPTSATAGTYLQCKASDATIYNTTELPGRITKIVVKQHEARAFSLYCGKEQLVASNNTNTGVTPSGTRITDISAAVTMTWNISGDYTFFALKKGNNASYITSIVITYQADGGQSETTYYHSTPECADPCDALQAPNVTATATANSITLSWAAVPGATSYNIYNYTTEETDETTNLTYTFNGLDPETEYEWEVEAVSATCNGKGTVGTTTTQKACTDAVNVNKGTPSNGSFTMVSGRQSTCDGSVTVTLSDIEPATGYQFSAITQSGVDAAKVTINNTTKTVTYAQNTSGTSTINVMFTPVVYTITYKDQGGANFSGQHEAGYPTTHTYNTATTLKSASKEHYTFGGWYKESDCSGTPVTTLGATEYTDNITLYAQWTAKTYTITLDANGGTFVDNRDSQTKGSATFDYIYGTYATYSDAPNLMEYYTDLKRDGYQFDKWVSAGSPWNKLFTSTGDRTIQAQWSKLYSITLSENGTTKELTPQTSTSYTLPTELTAGGSCQDDTKELVGWSTVAIPNPGDKPTSDFYELGETVTLTEDQTTFYAVFATPEGGGTENVEATLSFASTTQRDSQTSSKQVWSNEGITFTNNKGSSTTAVADYSNPVRLYKSSDITIEAPGNITQIEFNCVSDYVISVTGATTSGTTVMVTLDGTSDTYTIKSLSAQVRLNSLVVTYTTSGGTSYSGYVTSCVALPDPVISFVTIPADPIEFDPVNCGSTTSKAQAKTVQVSGANLQEYVSVEVTGPYKIARTSSTNLSDYTTSLTLDKTKDGTINNTIYIISCPPAQSTDATTGTLTFTTKKGNTLTVNLSTPTVNCTTYALTFNDHGNKTVENYYAGVKVPQPADPTGVCTDPIHYVFDGWAEATVANGSTEYTKVTFPYTMPGRDKTLYAVYRYLTSGGNGDYNLVTSALDDWSGDYLIAYNNETFADGTVGGEDGIGEDGKKVNLSSYINNNTISATEGDKYNVTLEAVTGGYVLKTQDGKYNYHTNNTGNGISASTISFAQKYPINVNFVSQEEVNLCLTGDALGSVFRYNDNSSGYFRFYKNGGMQPVYLYKKSTGTTLYTTSPACGPHLEITAGKEIYVTGGNAKAARDLVMAQQKVSYKATRLEKDKSTGNLPSIKALPSNIVFDNTKTKAIAVTFDEDSVRTLQSDGTYTITGNITIAYQPEVANVTDDIQVTLNANYNPSADVSQASFTVHARSLPEEFVIVAKSDDKWYALNADMSSSKAQPANGQVTLNDLNNPTEATFAPCNAIYTFEAMPQGAEDRISVRFIGQDNKYLWAASGTNTGIQNNSTNPAADALAYNWKLETEDNITYKFHNDNNSRLLGLNGEKFGMYASGVQEFRILPYEAKCLYNYAPSNLKVSVLKSTYVTLTWDAVIGATKYQYSTNGTTWTDCGTEPTVTINDLEGNTKYTYYIRAYHEDAGVNQECIDYAEITFTTANCDDVPANITYTADLNSITVSWTAAAPTATIKLFMNEDGTGGGGTYPGAISPYKISGGLTKNTTYYIQILSDGTCASPIIPVKTEDVEVDIVEWYPQGIIVDINTDETVSVSLENEVSYGSGAGAEATELFFSKYYEATTNVKLVAIYNGTKNIIDLTDYEIHYGKTPEKGWETNYITLKDFGEIKGQIQPGEELILYTMSDSDNSDKQIMGCVNAQYPDGKWVRVTQTNNTGKGSLSFAGDKTIVLKKEGTIIDIIGAINSNGLPNNAAVTRPSWGDANGWTCATGLSIADDTEIGISTNRCLLIRNNTVTSGANAVTSNIDDFVTLCSEWKGAQVPDNNVDNGVAASCENFAYVGTFDYSDYYTQFETMGEEQTFDENARNADGTVTIPITNLYKQSCRNIRITLEDKDGNVLSNREYKVPIMITTTQGTDGQAFIDLRHNLATKIDDGNGGLIDQDLTYEEVLEICKTCDVVIRDNATLQKMADDAENDHPQVRDIYVYENSSLIVPNGTNYTINNLSLRRKEDAVASVSAYPEALILPESAAAPISLDFRLSAESWHWFTLPYDCNISEVTWVDGSPAQYNVDWFLMTYDGKTRAQTQTGGNWKAYTGTTIKAGEGFILAINGNINNPAHTYELRFPMSKDVLVAEGIDKTVDVRAWGVETNIRPNHKGWNLVGNPYLAYYLKDNINSFEGLRLGELVGPNPQTGYWTQTGDVPYVVVPIGAGYEAYEQLLASETDLLPFTAYFVQVGNDGTHNSSQDLKVSFDHTKLQLSATPMPASIVRRAPSEVNETEEPVIVGVALTNSLGESDKTSLVIADRFTNEYEMQADFFKWFGDYYKYYTKPVLYTIGADQEKRAFNALNEELAKQPIPMGMFAAKAGDYTFALNRRSDLSKVEEVWLHDANTNTYTNLMQNDYNFYTTKTDGGGRFTISVKLAQKVATGMENVNADKVWATTQNQQIIVNGLENNTQLWIYDAAGKLLYTEVTSNYQHLYSVPQVGTYFIALQKGTTKQTIKVVVE